VQVKRLGQQNMVASDFLEAKQSLNVGVGTGIGISVMAAVLATICYLTLSQPHFTDAGDFVQLSILSIWILRITKYASVFFAIASIMVAMPKPPKDRRESWHCTQESIEFAMGLLIISIFGMLIGMLIAFIVVSCAAPIFYVVLVYCLLWLKNFIC
jgi:cytochrome c biogenesis protein CcdA